MYMFFKELTLLWKAFFFQPLLNKAAVTNEL